jgi:hypothetical protein
MFDIQYLQSVTGRKQQGIPMWETDVTLRLSGSQKVEKKPWPRPPGVEARNISLETRWAARSSLKTFQGARPGHSSPTSVH